MRLHHELRYDGAAPEQVHAMLADTGFRERVCEFQHFPRYGVTIVPSATGMRVRVDQHRPADEVPSFARKFIGSDINVVQEEEWSSATEASLTVTIPGKPGRVRGSVRLAGDAAGTTETVEADIKVNIPLVAGKLEALIGEFLVKALKAENKVGRDWLAG